jgi:hypothetical protein
LSLLTYSALPLQPHAISLEEIMNPSLANDKRSHVMSVETLIAAGVFGWLVFGMVMMGLGIW